MLKNLHPGLKFAIPLVIFIIVVLVGHKIIENKVFDALKNQPGVQVSIGSRSGNLLSGYKLRNFSITQRFGGYSSPPETFYTPALTVHWSFNPFRLNEISWQPGTLTIESSDGDSEEFPIGEGIFLPDEMGWLAADPSIPIGEATWDGTLDLRIRMDIKEIEGKILIEHLPGRLMELMGDAPAGFGTPREVRFEMDLSGGPESINTSGKITDPGTRQTFRF